MIKRIYKTELVMFRTVLIILCFLLVQGKVMAQEDNDFDFYNEIPQDKWELLNSHLTEAYYLLLSDDGKRIVVLEQSAADNPTCQKTIDGKKYVSVVVYGENHELYWFDYRIEGKKVFRFNEKQQKDDLLMDFGLAVGDVFERPDGVKLQVVEVSDSLVEDGKTLGVLSLRGLEDENVWDKWVESYGSVRTGLHLADDLPGYQIKDMLFMERRNESFICSYAHGIYNDINKDYLRATCFNREDLKKDEDGYVARNRNYTIDENGFCFDWQPKTGKLYCMFFHEKDGNLKHRSIEAGDWIGTYGDYEGEEYQLSMDLNLSPGIYTFYDAEGGEQTITIGGDAEAIDAIENDASTSKKGNGLLFDLTGRRLSTAPQHDIYIQDGRKVLK